MSLDSAISLRSCCASSIELSYLRSQPWPQNCRPSNPGETALIKSAMFCCTCLAIAITTAWSDAPLTPVKVTAAEAAGPVFNRKDVVKGNGPDGPTAGAIPKGWKGHWSRPATRSTTLCAIPARMRNRLPPRRVRPDGRQSAHRIAQHPAIELAR